MTTLDDAVVMEMLYRFRIEQPMVHYGDWFEFQGRTKYIKVTELHMRWYTVQKRMLAQIDRVRRSIIAYLGWNGLVAVPGEKGIEYSPEIQRRLQAWPQRYVLFWIGSKITSIVEALDEIEAFMKSARIHGIEKENTGGRSCLRPMFRKDMFAEYALNWKETVWETCDRDGCVYHYYVEDKARLNYIREQYYKYLFADVFCTRGVQIERESYKALAQRLWHPVPKWKIGILFRPYHTIPGEVYEEAMRDFAWERVDDEQP